MKKKYKQIVKRMSSRLLRFAAVIFYICIKIHKNKMYISHKIIRKTVFLFYVKCTCIYIKYTSMSKRKNRKQIKKIKTKTNVTSIVSFIKYLNML